MGDQLERLAASLWKAQVVDAGVPQSVIDLRTPEAFADESPETRKIWLKFAKVALAEMGGVRVKPLVFEGKESDCFMTCDMVSRSYDLFVVDTLERSCDYAWKATHCESGLRDYALGGGTLEDAIAAANKHHRARILAAVEPTSSGVREAIQAALERFESCASEMVPKDYAKGYREACAHISALVEGKDDE